MENRRNNALQKLCREYLRKLRYYASKHNLKDDLNELIKKNKRKECVATEAECMMLARMCDEERIGRTDVPQVLGKSYRRCVEDGDFDDIKQLPRMGTYSKVSAILHKTKVKSVKSS